MTVGERAWASCFGSETRYRTFVDAVEQELRRRGLRVQVDHEAGAVRVEDRPGGSFGLENIAQRCNAEVESSWPALIEDHLNQILQGEADVAALERTDFEKVRSLLRVKLYDSTLAPPDMFVGRSIADNLFAALVYDLPTSVTNVSAADVRGWGIPLDDLLRLGLSNVWEGGPLAVRALPADPVRITELSGRSFFAATHMLVADRYVAPHARHGLLVACPTRHTVFVHAIGDGPLTVALRKMTNVTHALHEEGPGSITASLYWWQPDGTVERLATERRGDETLFTPSDAFGRLLAELESPAEDATSTAEDVPYEGTESEQVTETAMRINALLAEALPIVGRRTTLAVDVDSSTRLSRAGFVCPLKVFVSGAPDPGTITHVIEHDSFVLFPRRVLDDTARCEAALRSALQRLAIEIGLAKVPAPGFADAATFFSGLFPFSCLDSKLEAAAQDAAIKADVKKAFVLLKL